MANYRNISISFWTDSKVDDDFTPEDKYFYLYLLTNPHTNICGCYEISMKQMERETGYNTDTIKRLLQRMENQHKVIQYSQETKEVLILNWCKYNWTDSAKVKSAVGKVAIHIKSEQFKRYVIDILSIGYPYRIDTLSMSYTYPMDTSVSDTDTDTVSETGTVSGTETETETENRYRSRYRNSLSAQNCASGCAEQPKIQKFIPPTVDEVRAYCNERRNGIDAEEFVSFYESKGWMIGRNKMKNWKSAIITWEKNRKQREQPSTVISDAEAYNFDWDKIRENYENGQ
jgi:hypothetical protein